MSFIVSDLDGQNAPDIAGAHRKHSLVMNGSPRTSSQLPPVDTSSTAINGTPIGPGPIHASPTKTTPHDGALEPKSARVSSDASQASHTYPPPTQPGSKAPDGALRVPNSTTANRRSSPARFPHPNLSVGTSNTSSQELKPSSPKLHHRHTLEVPRVSASIPRLSRENTAPDSAGSDGINGKFSPTHRRRTSLTLGRRTTRSLHSDSHVDEITQDEDAARFAEALRQKRASRRRRKEEEDDDRVVVGTKVDQNHVNWITAYNMLTGIRFTVSRTNAKLDRTLTDADFAARHKFSFDITGNEITPGAKYDFKFKDYAPWVFRHLREIFKIDPADYLMSLTSKYILSELGSPGKSGSFFYFSRDYKYIIKTIHHAEHVFLRKILRQYYEHVNENRNTLLSQFYGLHRVKIPYGRKIHFVVMNNLFPPHRDIHRTFDLKGSTIGRNFREEDIEKLPRATLKDLNWIRRDQHLELGPEKKQAFMEQMKRDVQLLERLKIMDYSLLVGIHDLGRGNEENLRDKTLKVFQPGGDTMDHTQPASATLMRSPSKLENARKAKELRQMIKNQRPIPMGSTSSGGMPDEMPDEMAEGRRGFYFYSDDGGFRATHEDDQPGEEIYYLGIIDCLTRYNLIKKSEHFLKGLATPANKSGLSAVPPDRYGARFVDFISGITVPRRPGDTVEKRSESGAGERARTTVDSAAGDATLPVVEEAAENASTGGRSGRSAERNKEAERGQQEEKPAQG